MAATTTPTRATPAGLILAIDTSGPRASVALCTLEGDLVLVTAGGDPAGSGRSGRDALPWTDALLLVAGRRREDVAAVAVARGPGSFTGVRVGVATALGVALGGGLPAYGVSTLAATIEAARLRAGTEIERGPLVVALLHAGKERLAFGYVGADGALVEGTATVATLLSRLPRRTELLLVGPGAATQSAKVGRDGIVLDDVGPLAPAVGRIAASLRRSGEGGDPGTLSAVYLRPSGALTPAMRERRRAAAPR